MMKEKGGKEQQEEHEAGEAEVACQADERVEVIKRAYRRLRRLDEVPDADGRGQGNIEKSEPLCPFNR